MADDLMPCPFCGSEAYLRDDVSHSTAFFIGCSTEGCFGEIHWEQTAAKAVAAWNARAPDPRIEALDHDLKEAVRALQIARVHVANNECGWSVSRSAARFDLEVIDHIMEKIGASKL